MSYCGKRSTERCEIINEFLALPWIHYVSLKRSQFSYSIYFTVHSSSEINHSHTVDKETLADLLLDYFAVGLRKPGIIKKNAFESVLMRWMKLEPITQSEVQSERKTPIQYTNTYMWNLERW